MIKDYWTEDELYWDERKLDTDDDESIFDED